jgi:hypothetical protein
MAYSPWQKVYPPRMHFPYEDTESERFIKVQFLAAGGEAR